MSGLHTGVSMTLEHRVKKQLLEPDCAQILKFRLRSYYTHRKGRIRIDLILGSDAEAGVTVSGSPRQVDGRLELLIHLLVDGATKLSAVISEVKQQIAPYVNVTLTRRQPHVVVVLHVY